MELSILISMLAVVMLVLLVLRISPRAWHRIIMGNVCFGAFALFGSPLSCVCTRLWHEGPDWALSPYVATAAESQLGRLFWLLLAADVLCTAMLFLIARVRAFSTWTIGILLALHYAFWLTVMATSSALSLVPAALSLSLVAFPVSGAIWLLYLKKMQGSVPVTGETRRVGRWTVAGAIVSGAMALVV